MKSGKLYIVATPIGNLDDISFRAINTLKSVDLILAEDTRHSLILLKHFDIQKPIESYHKFNEKEKTNNVLNRLMQGINIALISDAGTPGICDPGNILITKCIENGIDIVPIPGACAFIQSLICSGFNTQNFSFFGFLPVNNKERKICLEKMVDCTTKLIIIYEAPHKLLKTLEDIQSALGNVQICISKEITKIHEQHFRGNIADAIEYYTNNAPKGEFVIIIEKKELEKKQYNISDKETQNMLLQYYVENMEIYSLKEISKQLANNLGLSKNEIYTFLVGNKNTM